MIWQYILYLIRWQASTPILFLCVNFLPFRNDKLGNAAKTVIANLIGAIIFFWVDRWIFG